MVLTAMNAFNYKEGHSQASCFRHSIPKLLSDVRYVALLKEKLAG